MLKRNLFIFATIFVLSSCSSETYAGKENFAYPLVVQKTVLNNWKYIHSNQPIVPAIMMQSCYFITTKEDFDNTDYLASDAYQEDLAKCYLYISRPEQSFSNDIRSAYKTVANVSGFEVLRNQGQISRDEFEKRREELGFDTDVYDVLKAEIDKIDIDSEIISQQMGMLDMQDYAAMENTDTFRRTVKYLFRYYDESVEILHIYSWFHAGVYNALLDKDKMDRLKDGFTKEQVASQTLIWLMTNVYNRNKFTPEMKRDLQGMFALIADVINGKISKEEGRKLYTKYHKVGSQFRAALKEIISLDPDKTIEKIEKKARQVPAHVIVPLNQITG